MSYSQNNRNRNSNYRNGGRGQQAPPEPARAPVIERPGPDVDPKTGKKDWSRYNATTVGYAPDLRAPVHPICLPGLNQASNLPPSRIVSLAEDAPTEWTHVGRVESKRVRRDRNRRRREETIRFEIDEADEYPYSPPSDGEEEWKGKKPRRGNYNARPRTPQYSDGTDGSPAQQEA
jgi:hypothetical protein